MINFADNVQMKIVLKLENDKSGGACFGPGCAELLRRIDEMHSIKQAAAEMYLSYSKALKLIRQTEAALGYACITTRHGGNTRGGSELTDRGRALLDWYDTTTQDINCYAREKAFNI